LKKLIRIYCNNTYAPADSGSGIDDPGPAANIVSVIFYLYQLAYAELYFTQVRWPDFRKENLYEALLDFQGRERRFGKTSEQVVKDVTLK
jgi:hypothetical protein